MDKIVGGNQIEMGSIKLSITLSFRLKKDAISKRRKIESQLKWNQKPETM